MMAMCGQIKGGNTTFKESIEAGISPKVSSLSCTSIFSKYIFDLIKNETKEFVDLSLLVAQSFNPLNSEMEKYLSIGLLSSEDGKNHREPLNLVLVIDVSGSMSSSLGVDKWYKKANSKLDLAKSCVKNIYSKLSDNERLGVLSFNDSSEIILKMQSKKNIKKSEFFKNVDSLTAGGGTSLEAGYKPAIDMIKQQISEDVEYKTKDSLPINHRIIFITDAMINNGDESDLLYNLNQNSSAKPFNIFTTFIGVGIDFDTDLIAKLTKVRGSNYFAVHSDDEFVKTLDDDFNYMVTPLCFDVYVKVDSKRFMIERTFGSEFDFEGEEKADSLLEMKKGGILRVETLSAYEKTKGGIKGGVVLVKLKEKLEKNDEDNQDHQIFVTVEFEDIRGEKHVVKKEMNGKIDEKGDFFPSSGVRKALLLSRYVTFVKEFLEKEKIKVKETKGKTEFLSYFEKESAIIGDKLLKEEYDNMKDLLSLK